MSEAEFILFRSLNTHEVLIIIEDTRILGCVADSLQERRFTSVGPSDHKDTKMSIFCSKIIGITVGHHGRRWVRVKRLRGNTFTNAGSSCPHWYFKLPIRYCIKESNCRETWWIRFEARSCTTKVQLININGKRQKKSMSFFNLSFGICNLVHRLRERINGDRKEKWYQQQFHMLETNRYGG